MAVNGMRQVITELRQFGEQAERMVNAEIEAAAFQIEQNAKQLAPKNFGKLAQSISKKKVNDSHYKVTVNEIYGAYMEFGTGAKVKVPNEFKNMAESFRGSRGGTFAQALDAIKVWCRSKGIDEKASYPILAKILGAGVNPQPFLYPAYMKGTRDLLKNLNKLKTRLRRRI